MFEQTDYNGLERPPKKCILISPDKPFAFRCLLVWPAPDCGLLATLVALHLTRQRVGKWARFRTSVASRLASLFNIYTSPEVQKCPEVQKSPEMWVKYVIVVRTEPSYISEPFTSILLLHFSCSCLLVL